MSLLSIVKFMLLIAISQIIDLRWCHLLSSEDDLRQLKADSGVVNGWWY